MEVAIYDLMENAINYSNTAFNNYSLALNNLYTAKNNELDYITAKENQQLNQFNTIATVIQNNADVLMNMSTNTLKEYAAMGMPAEQVKMFRDWMVNKTLASFS